MKDILFGNAGSEKVNSEVDVNDVISQNRLYVFVKILRKYWICFDLVCGWSNWKILCNVFTPFIVRID